jgi:hypothetical protein
VGVASGVTDIEGASRASQISNSKRENIHRCLDRPVSQFIPDIWNSGSSLPKTRNLPLGIAGIFPTADR